MNTTTAQKWKASSPRQWGKGLVTLFVAVLISFTAAQTAAAASGPVLKAGSKSGDVWDLQFRLQSRGYDPGPVDGKFGARTKAAVLRFQRDYGLRADGIVGPHTWRALKKVSVNADELTLLARTVYSEARGEPYTGKVAVAAVVMNRLASTAFPDRVADVIFQPWAFTAVHDGQFWLTPDASAYAAARDAVRGWDPTNGALYYFNPDTATSKWIWSRKQTGKIGRHLFAI